MLYRVNGRLFSGLSGVVIGQQARTVTEAERQQQRAKELAAQTPAGKARLAAEERKKYLASLSFEQLEAEVFMKNAAYKKYFSKMTPEVRKGIWLAAGKPTSAALMTYARGNTKSTPEVRPLQISKDWKKREAQLERSQAIVAAAEAVQSVAASNPALDSQALVASAARAVQVITSPAAAAEAVPSSSVPAAAQADVAAALAPSEQGAGGVALSLLAAGAWFLFGS